MLSVLKKTEKSASAVLTVAVLIAVVAIKNRSKIEKAN